MLSREEIAEKLDKDLKHKLPEDMQLVMLGYIHAALLNICDELRTLNNERCYTKDITGDHSLPDTIKG